MPQPSPPKASVFGRMRGHETELAHCRRQSKVVPRTGSSACRGHGVFAASSERVRAAVDAPCKISVGSHVQSGVQALEAPEIPSGVQQRVRYMDGEMWGRLFLTRLLFFLSTVASSCP